jgi:hypothetical protein
VSSAPIRAARRPDGRLAYVEFRLGDYQHELGLVESCYAGGVVAYWQVDDPFGNVLGVMYNPHYLDVRGRIPAFELPEVRPDVRPG